jgi:hypothetical protein
VNKNEIIEKWEEIQAARVTMEDARVSKLIYVNEQKFEMAAFYRDLEKESGIFLFYSGKLTETEQRRHNIKYHGP